MVKKYNLRYGFNIKTGKSYKVFSFGFIPLYIENKKLSRILQKIKFHIFKKQMLCNWYREQMGNKLNLKNPKTFNEKIQWMKLYDSTDVKARLADKYAVREWIKEQIGEQYLIPLLGVWDKFDDIDFDKLPNQFVLKCNHGCGYNIIVKDKSQLDISDARKKINLWLSEDFAYTNGFEMHYSKIKRKIIAEEYISSIDQSAIDYKFICFDGEPYLCWVTNKYKKVYERSFYSIPDWEYQDIKLLDNMAASSSYKVPKPEKLGEMLKIAEKLSKGFPFVRVDLYLIEDKIFFGEMTFTSSSGKARFVPEKWDYVLGSKIVLPKK